jgi:FixJ family two-component response regulator
MSSSTVSDLDPLAQASRADAKAWDDQTRERMEWLGIRDRAVAAAIATGYTAADVATALRIRVPDVERILSSSGR